MYRLFAIDIDGTLVNSRDELTPDTQAALARVAAAGVRVVLATGRRYSHALPLVAPLGLDVPLITASGALIKNPRNHQTLYQSHFDPAVLEKTLALIDRAGYDPVASADTFAQGFDFYLARHTTRTPELENYLMLNPGRARIEPKLLEQPPSGVFATFVLGQEQQMLDLEATLQRELPGRLQTHVLHPPRYVGFVTEITPIGVTKWSAIQRLAHDWQITDAEICAIGDDVNDIPMIRAAGLGVAMGNAVPQLKAVADRIAPTHDENGVAEVVEWLLEGIRN
jgi:Cof subfamily protein (haloacid dehalogenase superfamily)